MSHPDSPPSAPLQPVVVTDIRMPFTSMVMFMVKWAIAAIPAILILVVIVTFAVSLSSVLLRLTPEERARTRHEEALLEYERDQKAFLDSLKRVGGTQP